MYIALEHPPDLAAGRHKRRDVVVAGPRRMQLGRKLH